MSGVNNPYRYAYETVAASQTGQVLGGAGAKGDFLHRLVVTVTTSATSQVTLLDGATSYIIIPANAAVGVYPIMIEAASASGAWSVTTAAGVSVFATGIFSA